jgi:hypothetical protein
MNAHVTVITEPTRRRNAWRNLPREVRRRLRRQPQPDAANGAALVAWAYARWWRAGWLSETIVPVGMAAGLLELGAIRDHEHAAVSVALSLVAFVSIGLGRPLRTLTRRRANDAAVLISDAATAITVATSDSARPLELRRRSVLAAMTTELTDAAIFAAGWVAFRLMYGEPPVVVTITVAALLVILGVTAIRRVGRRGALADLDHKGIRLNPNGRRVPWTAFSSATVTADRWGGFDLVLTARTGVELSELMGQPGSGVAGQRSISLDLTAGRESPLDVLTAVRRFLARS